MTSGGFVYHRRVHYQDCDPHGIMFNSHMYAYLDEALKELAREQPELSISVPGAGAADGIHAFATTAHLRFLLSLSFGDDIDIQVEPTDAEESRATWEFSVTRGGERVAEAAIQVQLQDENGQTVALPESLRSQLAALASA